MGIMVLVLINHSLSISCTTLSMSVLSLPFFHLKKDAE